MKSGSARRAAWIGAAQGCVPGLYAWAVTVAPAAFAAGDSVLARVAGLLFLVTLLDIYWIVVPAYEVSAPQVHVQDVLGIIGLGGLWMGAFFWQYKKRPLLPLHDPRFEGALEHSHGD